MQVGVQVVREHAGRDSSEAFEPRDRLLEEHVRREVVEVADVRTEPRAASPSAEAERVLQQRSAAEHAGSARGVAARLGRGTYPRARRRTIGAPAITRATESSHGAAMSRSWREPCVGDGARDGRTRRRRDRRVVPRTGCRTSSPADRPTASAQQAMQGGVRAGTGRRAASPAPLPEPDAPPSRRAAQARSAPRRPTAAAVRHRRGGRHTRPRARVAHHHGERLLLAALSLAQPRDGVAGRRVAREEEARRGPSPRRCARRPARGAASPSAGRPRSACPRGQETRAAGRTDGHAIGCAWNRRSAGDSYSARHARHISKAGHGRRRAVVGNVEGDGEPRTAVGAVGERVPVTGAPPGRRLRQDTPGKWPGLGGLRPRRCEEARYWTRWRTPPARSRASEPSRRRARCAPREAPRRRVHAGSARVPACGPKASIVTPSAWFQTRPVRACTCASRYTHGRNPTPWTVPRTSKRSPLTAAIVRPSIAQGWSTLSRPGPYRGRRCRGGATGKGVRATGPHGWSARA